MRHLKNLEAESNAITSTGHITITHSHRVSLFSSAGAPRLWFSFNKIFTFFFLEGLLDEVNHMLLFHLTLDAVISVIIKHKTVET